VLVGALQLQTLEKTDDTLNGNRSFFSLNVPSVPLYHPWPKWRTPDRDWVMQSLVDRSFRHALGRMDGRRFPHPAREDSRGPA
jgi:hypothetical protein